MNFARSAKSVILSTSLAGAWILSLPAFAAPTCQDLLKSMPTVIEQSYTRPYPVELKKSGLIYSAGEKLPELTESGLYHYLITKDLELVLTPSYVGKRLATHKSLVARYEELKGKSPEVVAAGDMQAAFGHVIFIDNRSGNFRGGEENLKFAAKVFESFGAKMDESTDVHLHDPVHDKKAKGHTPEGRAAHKFIIDNRTELRRMANGQTIWDLFEQTGKLLIPATGQKNPQQMLQAVMNMKQELLDYGDYAYFIYPLQTALNTDGLAFGILRTMKSEDADLAAATSRQLLVIQKNFGAQMSPEIYAELTRLSQEFAKLSSQSSLN